MNEFSFVLLTSPRSNGRETAPWETRYSFLEECNISQAQTTLKFNISVLY